ncbi:hypothetical protein GINT2_001813 [Glugoides intestinalis]
MQFFFILLAIMCRTCFASISIEHINQLLEAVEFCLKEKENTRQSFPIIHIKEQLLELIKSTQIFINEKKELRELEIQQEIAERETQALENKITTLGQYFIDNDVQDRINELLRHQQYVNAQKDRIKIAEAQLNVLKDNKKTELQILYSRKNEKLAELSKIENTLLIVQEQRNSLLKTLNSLDVQDKELKDKLQSKNLLLQRALEKENLLIEAIHARSEHTKLLNELGTVNEKLKESQSVNEEMKKKLEEMKKGSVEFQEKKVIYDEFISTLQTLDSIKEMLSQTEQLEKELKKKQEEKEQKQQQIEELRRLMEETSKLKAAQEQELEIMTKEAKKLEDVDVDELGEKEISKSVKEAISAKEGFFRWESMRQKLNGVKREYVKATNYVAAACAMITTTFMAIYKDFLC